jgi:hypothetical protein
MRLEVITSVYTRRRNLTNKISKFYALFQEQRWYGKKKSPKSEETGESQNHI